MRKSKMSRRRFLKLAGAATIGSMASGFPAIINSAPKEILIGVVLPLTGMVAESGGMALEGLELAVEHVNKANGIKSLGGAKLKLLVEDSESKVDVGGIVAEKLIQKGVTFMTGAFQNAVTLNVARITERHKIPFVNNISSADDIAQQGFRYFFRVFVNMSTMLDVGIVGVQEILKQSKKPVKTAVVVNISEFTGNLYSESFIKKTKERGEPWNILKRITYPENAMSLASEIRDAKSLNPDIVFATCRLRDGILLIEEMYKQKFDVEGIFGVASPGFGDTSFAKQGKLSEYAFNITPWFDEVNQFSRKIGQEYEARFKKPFNMNASGSYDTVLVIASALERAGSADREDLRKALTATKLTTKTSIGGPIEFDEYGNNKGAKSGIMQIQGGKPKIVYPPEAATAKAIFPVPPWDKRT